MALELSGGHRSGTCGVRKLFRFRGGVHLSGFKRLSSEQAIRPVDLPERIVIPLRQHIGAPAEPVVSVGQQVLKGQLLATTKQFVSAAVHASTSGTVVEIGHHVLPHTAGLTEPCIIIAPDGQERWDTAIAPQLRPETLSAEEIRERIRGAGIVGLGGAVFPSSVKLKPTRRIDTLLINGAECEPYITCDDALMRARADSILRGCLLLKRLLDAPECIVAIEDNKPAALQILRDTLERFVAAEVSDAKSIEVVAIPTLFPAGGEKQLIKVVSGKEVPPRGLPYEVGVVCLNVGTTAAVYDAIYDGKPLISRVVTVTGPNVPRPGNYQVLIGTPIRHVLRGAGVEDLSDKALIMGGPMMGQQLQDVDAPVVKATNCLLIDERQESRLPVMPCIRCGACAQACPMQLLPQQLYWHGRAKNLEKLEHYHLADCIECGCCAVVCPAQIPLVHYFRFAKSAIKERDFKRDLANQSRIRNEARQARLERIKQEQEARKAAKRAARQRKKQGASAAPAEPGNTTVKTPEAPTVSARAGGG